VSQQVIAPRQPQSELVIERERESLVPQVGRALKRKEDPRLLTGRSKYVDDMKFPDIYHSAVLRSSYAHAKIRRIDVSEAIKADGVKLIYTADNLPIGIKNQLTSGETKDGVQIVRPILPKHEATYVGEPIAFVLATTRYYAEDALELINVEYEELPAVVDPERAIEDASPRARLGLRSNLVTVEKREYGDVESAFQKAAKIVKFDQLNQRIAPSPLETRGCVASFDRGSGVLTLWISTQGPFQTRSDISEVLNLPENKVRVIAPEVGGGFGAKISLYSEEVLASLASMELGQPVKWIETRSENFLSMTHGRGQNQHVEIAASDKGRILGLKVRIIGDAGAFLTEGSSDSTFTLRMVPGCYIIPAYSGETSVTLTNKVPHDAYRGASRPEATFIIERAIDELARELGIDPAEVRLRNYIPKEDFPYKTVGDFEYDSGDYATNLRKALELSGYDRWRLEQKRAREQGRLIGIGLVTYVEICAFGPEFPQTASITVSKSGKVTVISGNSPHGQGHETPLAQIVADKLGITVDEINVVYGDTAQLAWGTFTAGSRSGALGGTAVYMCADKLRDKMAKIAANSLGISEEEIDFREGQLVSRKDRTKKISFSQVAKAAYNPKDIPKGMEPVLFAFSAFAPPNYTFPFGTHVAIVEIEKETGIVKILEYTSVDDVGKVLNPLIVEGQVHGGLTQGLGQAMLEQVKYNENGQLLSSSLLDYQIPQANDVPQFRTFRTETPTYANPLGIKGVGEAGTIGATPAIANAVADALAPLGIKASDMPFSPDYIKQLLSSNKNRNSLSDRITNL
jgi:carbon-monoxide dehydrogenase large subunit